jgi:hypothetical protein
MPVAFTPVSLTILNPPAPAATAVKLTPPKPSPTTDARSATSALSAFAEGAGFCISSAPWMTIETVCAMPSAVRTVNESGRVPPLSRPCTAGLVPSSV